MPESCGPSLSAESMMMVTNASATTMRAGISHQGSVVGWVGVRGRGSKRAARSKLATAAAVAVNKETGRSCNPQAQAMKAAAAAAIQIGHGAKVVIAP